MMCISYPRNGTCNANSHQNIGNDTSGKYGVVNIPVVDKYQRHSEDQPDKSRCGTARMNATEMLQDGGTAKAKPERRPLLHSNSQTPALNVCVGITLANNVLMTKYKSRPKSSFRTRMATKRLPRTKAPVY